MFCAKTLKPYGRGCAGPLQIAQGAPTDTQIPICFTIISMFEENMQKLVKIANMQNPMGQRARDAVRRW